MYISYWTNNHKGRKQEGETDKQTRKMQSERERQGDCMDKWLSKINFEVLYNLVRRNANTCLTWMPLRAFQQQERQKVSLLEDETIIDKGIYQSSVSWPLSSAPWLLMAWLGYIFFLNKGHNILYLITLRLSYCNIIPFSCHLTPNVHNN